MENETIKACGYFVVVACLLYLHYPFKIHRDNLAGEEKMGAGQKVRSSQGALSLPEKVGETFFLVFFTFLVYCFSGFFCFIRKDAKVHYTVGEKRIQQNAIFGVKLS